LVLSWSKTGGKTGKVLEKELPQRGRRVKGNVSEVEGIETLRRLFGDLRVRNRPVEEKTKKRSIQNIENRKS